MSQKHKRILSAILNEPVSGNVHWKEIESLLHRLGAVIEPGHGARLKVELNGVQGTLHRPHHSGVCGKHDIRHLRNYLLEAGISPESLQATPENPE